MIQNNGRLGRTGAETGRFYARQEDRASKVAVLTIDNAADPACPISQLAGVPRTGNCLRRQPARVPIAAKLIKGAQLKVYPGAPHGMCSTLKDKVNADLLDFFKR